jgi:hypothetical protein
VRTALLLRLDGREQPFDSDVWRLDLGPADPGISMIYHRLDPAQPVRWSELDQLPELSELNYRGVDAGIEAYAATRPRLRQLSLTGHERAVIDLAGAHVEKLFVDLPAKGPLRIRVPPSLRSLTLFGPGRASQVTVEGAAAGIKLSFAGGCPPKVGAVAGMEQAVELGVCNVAELPMAQLASYRHVTRLHFVRVGRLRGLAALKRWPGLTAIRFNDCFDLDADAMPTRTALPALAEIDAHGLRRDAADVMKARYQGIAKLRLRGVRGEAWLRANVDNPFREWPDEYGAAAGRVGRAAWKKASAALDAAKTKPAVRALLVAFIEAFNRLSVETTMREDIEAAYADLVGRAGKLIDAVAARKLYAATATY